MDNRLIVEQVKSLIEGTNNNIGALGNVAALLKETFDYYFWVGFYVVRGDELVLGPFQGPVACYSIKKGRGVCGTAWAKAQTLIVPNVHHSRSYRLLFAIQLRNRRSGVSPSRGDSSH